MAAAELFKEEVMHNFDSSDRERDEGILVYPTSYECELHHHSDCYLNWCECGCHDIEEDME
jgi:hypothetical protein